MTRPESKQKIQGEKVSTSDQVSHDIHWWSSMHVPFVEKAYFSMIDDSEVFYGALIQIRNELRQQSTLEVDGLRFPTSSLLRISNHINDQAQLQEWWQTYAIQSDLTKINVWKTAIARYDQQKFSNPKLDESQINKLSMLAASNGHIPSYEPYDVMLANLRNALCREMIIDQFIKEEASKLQH